MNTAQARQLIKDTFTQPFDRDRFRKLAAKKSDPSANTSKLEDKIDQMVYRLYDLLPDEIAQIEGALANTRRAGGKDDAVEEDADQ